MELLMLPLMDLNESRLGGPQRQELMTNRANDDYWATRINLAFSHIRILLENCDCATEHLSSRLLYIEYTPLFR